MKTVSRSKSGLFSAFFAIGGLLAFYFYRRQGGEIKPLIARGTDLLRTARETIETAAPKVASTIKAVAPEVSSSRDSMV